MAITEPIPTRGERKTRRGFVVSDKMDKTIVVSIVRKWKHPRYGKMVKSSKKYKAHDEQNAAKQGQASKCRS